tara:strand:- start:1537 stop:2184 length:648 start_codon:yes stop_codon:yes gene_type:complete
MKKNLLAIIKKNPLIFKIIKFSRNEIFSLFSLFQFYKISKMDLVFLELGSEKKGKNGWITISTCGSDIFWDLRKGIPLKDKSVDKIYSSHLLEHIPYQDLIPFLKECRRVLKNKGIFSTCVPNARNYIEAYFNKKTFGDKQNRFQPALVETGSALDEINFIAYMNGQHNYLFDEENLLNTLSKANFKNVKLRKYDPTLDFKERDFESIYAIASRN